jgi:hypothetical protein
MWALQLYIALFAKLPNPIPGALGVRFWICLSPRDQHPIIYIKTVLEPFFIPSPQGAIFSYPVQVRLLMFAIIK